MTHRLELLAKLLIEVRGLLKSGLQGSDLLLFNLQRRLQGRLQFGFQKFKPKNKCLHLHAPILTVALTGADTCVCVCAAVPVVRALVVQQPFLVQANLLQLMGQFLQVIVHLLSAQLLTHKFLNGHSNTIFNPITHPKSFYS